MPSLRVCDADRAEAPPASFDALATTLGIVWPEWYAQLVRALLDRGCDFARDFSFICMPPDIVADSTACYRGGCLKLFRREGSEERGSLVEIGWPSSLVIVGHTGGGDLAIDTAMNDGRFAIIDKEDYCLKPFLDVFEVAGSPEAFALQCLEMCKRDTPPSRSPPTDSAKSA